jgi:selenophosphate synthase
MRIDAHHVPIIEEALTLALQNLFPGGSVKNFEFVKPKVKYADGIGSDIQMILCDAQTSGGLLLAVPDEKSEKLLKLLHERGVTSAQIIGAVGDEQRTKIVVEKSK